jgi:aminopeptidase N
MTLIPRALALAVIGVLSSSAAARAQQIRPYQPAFDVSDYAIAIDVPDTGATIRAQATLSVLRTLPRDTLVLDLLDLTVRGVTVDGRAVRFTQARGTIAIPLPKRSSTRVEYKVGIDYGGAVTDGLIARADSAGRWTYFGDNWPDRARHWIPSIDHPSDKATVTWRITAPASKTVLANGKLVSTRVVRGDGAERRETVWRESRRIPVYLMVIAVAPLEQFDVGETACGLAETQRCVPQSVYTAPEQRSRMPGSFARVGEMVQLFARLVGKYPYEKLAHVQSSTRYGGMENASAIFYADAPFRGAGTNEGTIAHETAHQWFGDAVTEREWPHVWLSEGFATYFAALWTRAARGDSGFRNQMATIRSTILADSTAVPRRPVIDTIETDLLALLNRNSYEKGGFVLHMLRAQVGERAFFDAIRAYYAKYRHATAMSDDLRAEMERTSKQSLGWFFDQWLRRPGYPEVAASWSYDAASRQVNVELTQGVRFGAFRFPLVVGIVDSTGTIHRTTVDMNAAEGATVRMQTASASKPVRIVLDPDVALLANFAVTER